MVMKEVILVCYLICIIGIVFGLSCGVLAHLQKKTEYNRIVTKFLLMLLVICLYDLGIYYCNYVLKSFSSLEVMRLGNCLIAITMFFWIKFQWKIIPRQALSLLDGAVRKYLVFYAALWGVLTMVFPVEYFYTIKWILLSTDVLLIIAFASSSIAHIVYAAVAHENLNFYYMTITTALLIWNYISYFWGEMSVYWGNSEFIRAPLDLTVVFWLAISVMTAFYIYKICFVKAYAETVAEAAESENHKSFALRLEEVCEKYKITPREKEFIELICKGKGNREIAEELFLSESTVKTHIYNIFRKMNVKSRVGVVSIVNGTSEEKINNDE